MKIIKNKKIIINGGYVKCNVFLKRKKIECIDVL